LVAGIFRPRQAIELRVPAVSVIVPLYNKAPYVRRTLESVLAQTFTDFEVVVVDDGSTDGGGVIVAALQDPRLRVITQANRGVSAARNRGIWDARGDLVAFVDADDRWEPGFLEAVMALSKTYPQAGWFATGYRRCMGTGWDREVAIRTAGGGNTDLVDDYLGVARQGDVVTSSSVAIRRNVLNPASLFPEKQALGEDRDLWVRIGSRYPLAFDRRILAIYHSDAVGRASSLVGPRPATPPVVYSLRRLLEDGELSARSREQARCYLDWFLFKHATGMLYRGDRETIESFLRAASFLTSGFRIRAVLLRMALRWLPPRLLAAIWLKPAAALWTLRRTPVLRHLVFAGEVLFGRTVVLRSIRAGASE
jgi:glycosyltransferase involved in cell wall biosynthesis